ncbi:MAG: tetratricopeptide repeat protein [Saprospiraceae bacterium]|nr:tetratricopeptide repeat protein [Saprospiraceae bacterium]
MTLSRLHFTIFFLLCVSVASLSAQNKRAEKYYRQKMYKEAIPFLEKHLLKHPNDQQAKIKLAYSYRMINKMVQAEVLYNEIVFSDKVFSNVYLYYAEALMSNSKYSEAKYWLEKYLQSEPDDERASSLLISCDMVPTIASYFPNAVITGFEYNNHADDNCGVMTSDRQIVFSSDRANHTIFYDPKTARRLIRLFKSTISDDGAYSKPKLLSRSINSPRKNTSGITFSQLNTFAVFAKNSNTISKANTYNLQLYSCTMNKNLRPSDIKPLPFCNKELNYMHPCFNKDGRLLAFASDKAGGEGGTDIYIVEYSDKGWGKPQNLGTKINTSSHEGFPFFDSQDRLFFCSKGHPGLGGFDIFVSSQNEKGDWNTPINVGAPINSSHDDISFFLNESMTHGIFASSRNGGDDDLYWMNLEKSQDQTAPVIATIGRIIPKDRFLVKNDSFE